eukprot:TRINITY_DN10569_c2_g1_i1.p1 TRINITY_DN10569_c2_g1~~TRINITY_DN10569_c2_g1_i1.p1  ORF type:complete len:581 (-),score=129.91 TRINITY_DN10569_c2_g1_i1:48-1766(-)
MAAARLALALLLWVVVSAAAPHGSGNRASWKLPHHSFERTISHESANASWLMGLTTMAYKDRVLLMPPVGDRAALLWSTKAIKSTDFEIVFTLSGDQNGAKDGSVAFWLSQEDFASGFPEQKIAERSLADAKKDWKVGMQDAGLTFLCNRPNFKGLALVFTPFDGHDQAKQTIVGLWRSATDGPLGNVREIFKEPNAKIATTDWLHFGMQLKVQVKKDGSIVVSKRDVEPGRSAGSVWSWAPDGEHVEGDFSLSPDSTVTWQDKKVESGSWSLKRGGKLNVTIKDKSYLLRLEGNMGIQELPDSPKRGVAYYGGKGIEDVAWQQIATWPAKTFPTEDASRTGSFLGFSGYTGSTSGMEVELNSLQTVNYDSSVMGEDDSALFADDSDEWKKALGEEARYVDQSSQTDAVNHLVKLMKDHLAQEEKISKKVRSDLLKMQGRLDKLGAEFSNYLAATEAWSADTDKLDPSVVRDHISKFRSLLTQGKEVHNAKLAQVEIAANQLKETHSKNQLGGEAGRQKVQAAVAQSKLMKDYAAAGSKQSNVLLFVIVVAVGGLAYLFFSRMKYYEKKHFI